MKIRARYIHLIEAFTDNLVGLAINYWMIILVYNMMLGYEISYMDNVLAIGPFFAVSLIRRYYIRRGFSNFIKRLYSARA